MTYDLSLAHLESFDVQPCPACSGSSPTLVQSQVATARGAELTEHVAQSSVRLRSLRHQHLVHVRDALLLTTPQHTRLPAITLQYWRGGSVAEW